MPKGTILKVFKKDKPYLYPPDPQFNPLNLPKLPDIKIEYGVGPIKWTSSSEETWTGVKDEEPSRLPIVVDAEKKKKKRKKKKKHSQTRKIELD